MSTSNVTGRDGPIIVEALAFAYAAMKHLPQMFQPTSNMEDMRTLLFAVVSDRRYAESTLGQAMLTAWNLRADVPPTAALTQEDLNDNLRHIRQQVLQEPSGDADVALMVRHIDERLAARQA